jgi:hypothetical protein
MKKILKLLTCYLLKCNAFATEFTESTDVMFSVFDTELSAAEMFRSGFLVKKNIECPTVYDGNVKRALQDVYQLTLFGWGENMQLKIESENAKTKISLLMLNNTIHYDEHFNDCYGAVVDHALSCANNLENLSENDGLGFPRFYQSDGDFIDKVAVSFKNDRTIIHSSNGKINIEAKNIIHQKVIYSAQNCISLEVMPSNRINPTLRSLHITAQAEIFPAFQENPYYSALLVDGFIEPNAADVTVCNLKSMIINFDASIIEA